MGQCLTPFAKQDPIKGWQYFPCGKCPECLKKRASGWSFRLVREGRRWCASFFVTLTYDTDHVPISRNGFLTLDKRDLQLFFKRLRALQPVIFQERRTRIIRKIDKKTGELLKEYEGTYMYKKREALRYYAVGEYGTNNGRPHYHAIIFGSSYQNIERAWSDGKNQIGEVHFGNVQEASIGYTLKYMCKEGQVPKHARDDRQKEFSLMSQKLGSNYLTPEMVRWHQSDELNRYYVPIEEGKKIAMPRYYKNKVYTDEQRQRIGKHIQKNLENYDKSHSKTDKEKFDLIQQRLESFRKDKRVTKL